MRSFFRIALLCALVTICGIASSSAEAQDVEVVEWSMTPIACLPTSQTAAEAKYVTRAGKIGFRDNATGTIVFTCSVSQRLPKGKYFIKGNVSRGTTTSGGPGSADIRLRTANIESGAVGDLMIAATTVPSCSTAFCPAASQYPKTVNFNMEKTVYWVALTLRRSSPTQHVVMQGVQLIRVSNN